MKRLIAIFLSLLIIVGSVSCSSTRRASRQIDRILNNHPELLEHDTIRIDTIITAELPSDTVVFSWDDFFIADSNACTLVPTDIVTKKTDQGTFTIERLPSREGYKITYLPDTLQIRARATYTVPKITIQKNHTTDIGEVIKWLVIGIIVVLFARLLLKK